MDSLSSVRFQCAHCGEWIEMMFDPSGGPDQTVVEDCTVCCYPLVIHFHHDRETDQVRVDVTEEA